jgi:uncharacterized membrane protein YhdT
MPDLQTIKAFFSQNPTILTTFAYLYICLIGIFADSLTLSHFNIMLLSYLDTVDLIFAGIRNWVPLTYSAIPILFFFLCRFLVLFINKQISGRANKRLLISSFVIAFVVIPSFVAFYAQNTADEIKGGTSKYRKVYVIFSDRYSDKLSAKYPPTTELIFILATKNYFFFYVKQESKSIIVPATQIISITNNIK